jgi:hypothetical protein
MELNKEVKDRILAEEKYRMEIRKDMLKEQMGHWGHWGRWGHHGGCYGGYGCGCGHRGGFFKVLLLGVILFAIFHCGGWRNHYGACNYNAPAVSAPSADAPKAGK